jgi:glycosyltransferase involved in cell wall biosynthesis
MPRVLRIINRFNLGGPTHNVALLTRYLPPEYETMLVGGQWGKHEQDSKHILDALGVVPVVIPHMQRELSPLRDGQVYTELKRIIRRFRPHVVHTHAAKAGALGRMAAADLGVKAIVHTFHGHVFHSYFGPLRTALFKHIERRLAKRTHRIIAISPLQKEELVHTHRICPAEKVSVVPLGFDLTAFGQDKVAKGARFRQRWGLGQDDMVITIVGRLAPIKDHVLFLNALAEVEPGAKRIHAMIVGDGEQRGHLEAHARALGLIKDPSDARQGVRAIFTSWITTVDEVYAGSDIAVLSSRNEGTPVSLIEAQAAGCAVVSTNVGGVADVVAEGRTGLLGPAEDVNVFARNLQQLLDNENLRQQFAKAGPAHVMQRFHYQRLIADMHGVYRDLLG